MNNCFSRFSETIFFCSDVHENKKRKIKREIIDLKVILKMCFLKYRKKTFNISTEIII